MNIHRFSLVLLCLIFLIRTSFPCTAFLFRENGRIIMGKNYDWDVGEGLVLENKRQIKKVAFGVENPLTWVSKYGSVTFNQYGQDLPCGGINEKGLAIEVLWLREADYPQRDSLPRIDNMQWIQYHLDVSGCVEELIENSQNVTVSPTSPTAVHYFAADAAGNSRIIEFIDNDVHYYIPDSINPPVLTNTPYAQCVSVLSNSDQFKGTLKVPDDQGSLSRFIRTAGLLKQGCGAKEDPMECSKKILQSTVFRFYTQWTILYDISAMSVSYKTASNRKYRTVNLKDFSFDCKKPQVCISIDDKSGDVFRSMKAYTPTDNRALITKSVEKTPYLKHLTDEFLESLITYPQTFTCATEESAGN